MRFEKALESIGRFVVPNYLELKVSSFFEKRGIYKTPFKKIGLLTIIAIVASAIADILISVRFSSYFGLIHHPIKTIALLAASLGITFFAYVQYYNVINYRRTTEIEKVLPDYLSIVSSNLESGMTINNALWEAATPEFGILANEIKLAAKQVTTGKDLAETLTLFSKKYDSLILNRAIDLIIEGIKSGGELANIINRVVDNIQQTTFLKKEMQAASLSYVIFITAIVVIIAPFLFALSYNLLLIVSRIAAKIAIPQAGATFGSFSILSSITNLSIDPVEFKNFSYLAIVIIALFSSMIVSIINKEKIIGGLKYIPIFIIVSLVLFIIFSEGLALVFSALI
ncbi:type II secretion system F family protein [Candidatus Woesearchaeota archaeon]|nr:type II secretion system F family protein [Candidatus Woesearchaeota archaeon]MBW3022088.1 type II secretion system F family protein [Candidatus Woesearchaeota archaeon]